MLKFVSVENTKIAYEDIGEGEAVVLLHGYPVNNLVWRETIKSLKGKYRVIAIDLPGWGQSEQNLDLDYSYEKEVERLNNIFKEIGLIDFNFVIHDYGGNIGLGYALKYPEKVKRLAILNSRAHKSFNFFWYIMFYTITKITKISLTRKALEKLPIYEMHNYVLKEYSGLNDLNKQGYIANYLDKLKTEKGKKWLVNFFRYYSCKIHPDLGKNLDKIKVPTSIIWGAKDPSISIKTAEDLNNKIEKSKLFVINTANHFIMEEDPNEVNRILLGLLETPTNKQDKRNYDLDLSKTSRSNFDTFLDITFIFKIILLPVLLVLLIKKIIKK